MRCLLYINQAYINNIMIHMKKIYEIVWTDVKIFIILHHETLKL